MYRTPSPIDNYIFKPGLRVIITDIFPTICVIGSMTRHSLGDIGKLKRENKAGYHLWLVRFFWHECWFWERQLKLAE